MINLASLQPNHHINLQKQRGSTQFFSRGPVSCDQNRKSSFRLDNSIKLKIQLQSQLIFSFNHGYQPAARRQLCVTAWLFYLMNIHFNLKNQPCPQISLPIDTDLMNRSRWLRCIQTGVFMQYLCKKLPVIKVVSVWPKFTPKHSQRAMINIASFRSEQSVITHKYSDQQHVSLSRFSQPETKINDAIPGGYKEMSSIFVDQQRPRIPVPVRGDWWGCGVSLSQPMSTAVHITWHGAQINFGDLPLYLTICAIPFTLKKVTDFPALRRMSLTKLSLVGIYWNIPDQGEFGKWHPGWGRENK